MRVNLHDEAEIDEPKCVKGSSRKDRSEGKMRALYTRSTGQSKLQHHRTFTKNPLFTHDDLSASGLQCITTSAGPRQRVSGRRINRHAFLSRSKAFLRQVRDGRCHWLCGYNFVLAQQLT